MRPGAGRPAPGVGLLRGSRLRRGFVRDLVRLPRGRAAARRCRACAGHDPERGRQRATYDLVVENDGNTRATCRLSVVDSSNRLGARFDPPAWLAMRDIYGDVADAPAFRDAFSRWLGALWSDGTEAVLRRYLG